MRCVREVCEDVNVGECVCVWVNMCVVDNNRNSEKDNLRLKSI